MRASSTPPAIKPATKARKGVNRRYGNGGNDCARASLTHGANCRFHGCAGGETVVDLWGGHKDAERTEPWDEDTVCIVFSCT